MLELVAAALDAGGVSAQSPRPTAGWQDTYLPEVGFRGRDRAHLTFMLHAAAAFRGGLRPDLLEVTRWHEPLWGPAFLAAVMTLRAVAEGDDIAAVCARAREAIPSFES